MKTGAKNNLSKNLVFLVFAACSFAFVPPLSKSEVDAKITSYIDIVKKAKSDLTVIEKAASDLELTNSALVKEIAEHDRLVGEHDKKLITVDRTNVNQVNAYNKEGKDLDDWLVTINEKGKKLDEDRKENYYQQSLAVFHLEDATKNINFLIEHFQIRCQGGTLEEIVQCWKIYFDGDQVHDPMTVIAKPFTMTPEENKKDYYEQDMKPMLQKLSSESVKIWVPANVPPQKPETNKIMRFINNYLDNLNSRESFYKYDKPMGLTIRG
jgi:hypothetical protein